MDTKIVPLQFLRRRNHEPARHPRGSLRRQCGRLRLESVGGRVDAQIVPGDDLEVPIHGDEHAAAGGGTEGEDPGHQKDVGHRQVSPEASKGKDCSLSVFFRVVRLWREIDVFFVQAGSETPLETHFELNDTLHARATIDADDTDEVYLWLGANVMLAYPTDEAETMLAEKLRAAESSLSNCEEDLEFLREQITVCLLLKFRRKGKQDCD